MSDKYEEIDLGRINTFSVSGRKSKVKVDDFGKPVKGGKSFRKWYDSLPGQLAGGRLRKLVYAIRRNLSAAGREIIWMTGAHVVKCGLSPYLIELIKKKYITSLAFNGATLIHDLEIAWFGETSEDVASNLQDGTFGFAEETASLAFRAAEEGKESGMGLGEAMGRFILKGDAPHKDKSVLAQAYRFDVPATVHVAVGTDIIHQHPGFDGALWGELTHCDFRIFAKRVDNLGRSGGVVLNIGSAVIMPEVFLKALSVARNLGAEFSDITTCNLDMINHYRPSQ
ncbi:MAG: hypothetical protein GF417_02755, partial [Candidatus Latescibacteria bacterium]|nr:hypothetical protein [bacterium]MBD3423350.1 hypothetical protein [Candidatus Latescibacterota bacterium]